VASHLSVASHLCGFFYLAGNVRNLFPSSNICSRTSYVEFEVLSAAVLNVAILLAVAPPSVLEEHITSIFRVENQLSKKNASA
jgi:hypothetical protein